MKITDETGHKLLAYVNAAEMQGRPVTAAELNQYGRQPGRTRNIYTALSLGAVAGTVTETGADYLVRLSWAVERDGAIRLTPLGSAMLRHLDAEERVSAARPGVAVVLKQGDEFGFADVIARIATLGECTLVDPYFRAEAVEVVFRTTSVTRIITSGKDPKRLKALKAAVVALRSGGTPTPEVRTSGDFHDRFVVPARGAVWLLGTSLSGIGSSLSTMVELPDAPAGTAVRAAVSKAWAEAKPLVEPPAATVATA